MKRNLLIWAGSICGAVLVAGSASAANVLAVDFGGPYTEGNINSSKRLRHATGDFNFNGQKNDRVSKVEFGSIFTPPRSGNWNTLRGKTNETVYYGLSLAVLDNPSMDLSDMMARASVGRLQFGVKMPGLTLRLASAVYWESRDFLSGEGPVRLADAAGSLRADVRHNGAPPAVRFLVQSGGVWYISAERSFRGSDTLRVNGAQASWHRFDPSAHHLFLDEGNLGPAVTGSEIGALSAIGVYAQTEKFSGDDGSFFGLSSLQVQVAP